MDKNLNETKNLNSFDLDAFAAMDHGTKPSGCCPQVPSSDSRYENAPSCLYKATSADLYKEVEDVVEQLASRHIDLTEGYGRWVRLGFALASGLGEEGRQFFHQLSRMNRGYDYAECNKKFDSLLRSTTSGQSITISTFFQMAKDAGVDLSHLVRERTTAVTANTAKLPTAKKIENNEKTTYLGSFDKKMAVGSLAVLAVTPPAEAKIESSPTTGGRYTFSDKVPIEDWSSFLRKIFDIHHDAVSRDKMILGVLNVVSGLMGGANGTDDEPSGIYGMYDGRKVYAPLFNIVYGTAGSAKGDLVFCRLLAKPVKQEMRREYEKAMGKYEAELAAYEAANKGKRKGDHGAAPKQPPHRDPFMPGNSSAAAVYRALDANGGWGMMFETEADTISSMMDSDYGDYSDLMRKAYHHEAVSMNRVSEKIHIDIDRPRLSTFITCTPGQLPRLFPSFENGLGSRFQFYSLPEDNVNFHDVFALNEFPLEDVYREMGEELLPLYHALLARKQHPIQFVMSSAQMKEFLDAHEQTLTEQFKMLGAGITPFIFRTALANFRTAMVLSALRRLSDWNKTDDLFAGDENALACDDRDFRIAMAIEECLICHTAHVYAFLAKDNDNPFARKGIKMKPEEQRIYNMLPDEFKTAEFMTLVGSLNVSERNAYRMLGQMCNVYGVVKMLKRGCYRKVSMPS